MTTDQSVIRVLNNISMHRHVPTELERYIIIRYSESPSIFNDYADDDLYRNIRNDINSYEEGCLDINIEPKTPEQLAKDEWNELSDAFGHEREENERLTHEVCVLSSFIAEHNLNAQLETYRNMWSDSLTASDIPFN